MSLNYWKYFTFHPQILPKVYFLSPKLLKNSFFNPIFVSKLIKQLFTKYKDKKKNFLKFRNEKKNLLVKFRYKIFLLYFFTLYKKRFYFIILLIWDLLKMLLLFVSVWMGYGLINGLDFIIFEFHVSFFVLLFRIFSNPMSKIWEKPKTSIFFFFWI